MPPRSANGAAPRHISNEHLLRTCSQNGISAQLLQCRLRWLGHTLRMDAARLPKKLLLGQIRSTAPVQPGMPTTLRAQYHTDAAASFPRSRLRTLATPTLAAAAADRAFWAQGCSLPSKP